MSKIITSCVNGLEQKRVLVEVTTDIELTNGGTFVGIKNEIK